VLAQQNGNLHFKFLSGFQKPGNSETRTCSYAGTELLSDPHIPQVSAC
jgi:hypothetical protein